MKKPLAIILLIAGTLAAISALGFLNLLLFLLVFHFGILIDIAIVLAAGIGLDRLRKLFRGKYGLKAPLFFICAYLPSIAFSAVYYAVISYLDNIGYFKGLFAGLGEFLFGMSWGITALAFAAVGGLWLLISSIIEKKLSPKQTVKENVEEKSI